MNASDDRTQMSRKFSQNTLISILLDKMSWLPGYVPHLTSNLSHEICQSKSKCKWEKYVAWNVQAEMPDFMSEDVSHQICQSKYLNT